MSDDPAETTATGLRGATLHQGDGLAPLRDVEVTWGSAGEILSVPWEEFRDLASEWRAAAIERHA